jgi:hypothetical protein
MVIKSLDKMESIVKKNKELFWVGWNVVERKRSDLGRTSPSGIRVNNIWYLQKIFTPSRDGWDIPNKYGERND